MKNYTSSSPVFSDNVTILETTDTNHADNFNKSTKQLLDNDLRLKNAINKCEKITVLTAGQTNVIFAFDEGSITENSRISIEASVPDVSYENITVDGDNVTVTFEVQEEDIHVKAVVSDAVV
ncbi:MAG: hypothetical protein K1W06_11255 [Lachnospiraceae bacterium]